MNYYYAPMEGITLYPLRNVHREVFGAGVDKYYTPFLTAASTFHFKNREKKDVLPEKNSPLFLFCFAVSNPSVKARALALRIADQILGATELSR